MFRRLVFIAAALTALATFFVASSASAQSTCATSDVYGCGTPGFILTPPTTNVGGQITISGQGCDANQEVIFTINGQEIGRTVSGPDGTFSATFNLPPSLGVGQYTIIGTCGNTTMSNVITIEAGGSSEGAGSGGGGGTLVQTGSGLTVTLVRVGLLLIGAGGLILIATRRRREEPEPANG